MAAVRCWKKHNHLFAAFFGHWLNTWWMLKVIHLFVSAKQRPKKHNVAPPSDVNVGLDSPQ